MKVATEILTGPALDWAVAVVELAEGYYTSDAKNYDLPLLRLEPGWFSSSYGQSVFGPGDGRWQGRGSKDGEWQARGPSWGSFQPSISWKWAGPIIERERISLVQLNDLYFPNGNEVGDHFEPYWRATKVGAPDSNRTHYKAHGVSAIEAAMRCYVMSKLGDEVEIPEELCHG